MKQKKLGNRLGDAMPSPAPMEDPIDNYEVKRHLDTLMDAEKIKADPEKMKKVHKLAGRHSKALTSIKDLKQHYDTKYGSKKPGDVEPDADD